MAAPNRIEKACLAFMRVHNVCPDARRSYEECGSIVLCDETGEVLAQVSDGLTVSHGASNGVGMAHVGNFVVRVRCHACNCSTVRDAAGWIGGEVWTCHGLHQNILPKNPIETVQQTAGGC